LITLEFHSRDQQTELVLTQEKFASVESRDRHEQGWTGCLDQLERFFVHPPHPLEPDEPLELRRHDAASDRYPRQLSSGTGKSSA
ncbi:MAG: SRPBCC domain-containing protein, partial [Chthoniobacterales bacterium]|nr:SRPBCC domain-containing protein [Chthoniobacterales bacterium]